MGRKLYMKKFSSALIHFVIGALLVLVLWSIAHIVMDINVIPSPFTVLAALPDLANQNIATHVYHSFFRVAAALTLSMFIGLAVGICAAGNNIFARILTSFIYFTYPIPRAALLPAVMLIFGLTNMSKVIMITLIVVYPIIVVVRDSLNDIPKQTRNTLICYGANKLQIFFYITIPWSLTSVISTSRISLGTAVSVLFFTEAYGTRHGMGFFILDAWMRLNYIQMYAGIVILSLSGFVLFIIIDMIENIALKWKKI